MQTNQGDRPPRRVTATQATRGLSALLDEVLGGRPVVITRNGRPIVRLERAPEFDSEVLEQEACL
jgi:prevent-host-death family protein